jgi:AraC-like DNA-binding protein
MEVTLDLNAFVHLAAAVLGALSGMIILYFSFKSNPYNLPLAIGQIVVSIAIFVNFSLISKLIFHWPFMYRMGHVCILIFITMPYLNVVFHTKHRLWKWYDLLHLIPLLIFLLDYGHVLLMTNEQKVAILREEVNNLNLLGQFRQSKYIGPGFHEKFRSVLFSFYWVGQVVLFTKWSRSQKVLTPQDRIWKVWTMVFLVFQCGMFMPFYLNLLGIASFNPYHVTNSFVVIWLLLSSISLFFFPSLLYGNVYQGVNGKAKKGTKTKVAAREDQKFEELMRLVEMQMDGRELFLTQAYTINDFSKDIEIPVYQISKTLNDFKGVGFLDFVNQKRIQYCVSRIRNGEWLHYSIESIASNCGFSNRNTFTRAFKKFQGCFPSEFIKTIEP